MYESLSILKTGKKRKMEVDLTDDELDVSHDYRYNTSGRYEMKFFNSEPSNW